MKEVTQKLQVYDFISMTFCKRQNYRNRNPMKDQSGGKKLTTKGYQGIFQGNGNILYLKCGGGYTIKYVCQNS